MEKLRQEKWHYLKILTTYNNTMDLHELWKATLLIFIIFTATMVDITNKHQAKIQAKELQQSDTIQYENHPIPTPPR